MNKIIPFNLDNIFKVNTSNVYFVYFINTILDDIIKIKKTIYIKKRSLLIYIWLLILQKNVSKFLQLIIKFNARVYFCTTQIKFVSLLSIIWKYVRMRVLTRDV